MAVDPVSAIAQAVGTALGIAKPLITEAQAQAHVSAKQADCKEIDEALSSPDDADGSNSRIASVVQRLCIENGYPSGGMGPYRRIPADTLESLLDMAADRKCVIAQSNDFAEALTNLKNE